MVTERGILMNGPMVRATLAGIKTQTRRIAKVNDHDCKPGFITPNAGFVPRRIEDHAAYCPYGQPGDRLWVRETARRSSLTLPNGSICRAIQYQADNEKREDARVLGWRSGGGGDAPWRPSIHMPRWASRITLEIAEVRVERLNEISEADARAEGINGYPFRPDDGFPICTGYTHLDDDGKCALHPTPSKAFAELWESINGPGSWAANPLVWVVNFSRVKN